MKVYELIKALEKYPAGAEVETRMLLSFSEVPNTIINDEIDGEKYCNILGSVSEIEEAPNGAVILYVE